MVRLLLALALAGCSRDEADTDVGLPPEDTDVQRDTDASEFPEDTATGPVDEEPLNTITMRQWGAWELSPSGGPYSALIGQLHVLEWLDGDRPDTADTGGGSDTDAPRCETTFSLVGAPSPETCDGCEFSFDVTFTLVSGSPSLCHDPDLPEDGETHRFAYSASEQAILRDYGDIGLWLPWYPADRVGDRVTYAWEATLGIALEEEDE